MTCCYYLKCKIGDKYVTIGSDKIYILTAIRRVTFLAMRI